MNAKRTRHEISRANHIALIQNQMHSLQRRQNPNADADWWAAYFVYGSAFLILMGWVVPLMIGGR